MSGNADELASAIPNTEHSSSSRANLAQATVSPYMLPIELLGSSFHYLSLRQVAKAARVGRAWHAASSDARLWCHLTDIGSGRVNAWDLKKENPPPMREHSDFLCARSNHTVESVELLGALRYQAADLAQALVSSAASLKVIGWSKGYFDTFGNATYSHQSRQALPSARNP